MRLHGMLLGALAAMAAVGPGAVAGAGEPGRPGSPGPSVGVPGGPGRAGAGGRYVSANCLVEIEYDARVVFLSNHVLQELVASSPIRDLGQEGLVVRFRGITSRRDHMLGGVEVGLETDRLDVSATAVLSAVCARLQQALAEMGEGWERDTASRVAALTAEQDAAAERLETLRRDRLKVVKSVGGWHVTSASLLDRLKQLQEEKDRLELTVAEDGARLEALRKRIAGIGAAARDKIAGDPILKQLEKIAQIRQAQLSAARDQTKAGVAGQRELQDAEVRLAEAQMELARRREELTRSAGGALLEKLNADVATYEAETASKAKRLALVNERLAKADEVVATAARLQELDARIHIAERRHLRLLEEREKLAEELRRFRKPRLTVIGGKPAQGPATRPAPMTAPTGP